jgi:hypothetical protein
MATTKSTGNELKPVKIPEPPLPMNGSIDPEFIGVWKCESGPGSAGLTSIYKFNADGTYEFYVGDIVHPNFRWYKDDVLYWRLNGNSLETYSKQWKEVAKTQIEKKNVAANNKPAIMMKGKDGYNAFIAMDNKAPFAGAENIQPVNYGKNIPKDGLDPSIAGLWKYQYPNSTTVYFIKLLADGSYESYTGSVSPASRTDKGKCRWRVEAANFILSCDKAPESINPIEKRNDAATGRPMLVIGNYANYFSMDNKPPW